ncbi:MAG: ATP-binding protein [Acidobacteriota bacterium]
MNDTIRTILYEWKERKLPESIPREINLSRYLNIQPSKIIAVTGFRRVGKTYLVLNLINGLLKSTHREEVVYINFEDERIPPKTEFLSNLIPAIKQTFKKPIRFLFLDEIHNIPLWSKWLRRVHDTEKIKIFITGSSSKVSTREIPTELRGRCLEVNLFPLSFKEFLRFKNIQIDLEALKYSEDEKMKMDNALEEYIYYGGMPEVVLIPEEKKLELLQEYYKTVLRRDMVERFKIKNEEVLFAMVRLLLNSTYFSISKLYNNLKSMNYATGKNTLQRYLSYLESSYFFHPLLILSQKIKQQLQTSRKLYFIDNGFISALSLKFTKNFGRLYENVVFLELIRKYLNKEEIFYWKNHFGKEVDFVIRENFKIKQLIQVCYEIEEENVRKREITALSSAKREFGCEDLSIITKDYEAEERMRNERIRFVPLWKWLLHA